MKTSLRFVPSVLLLGGLVLAQSLRAEDAPKKILFFSKSSGYEHSVIKDPAKPFTAKPGSAIPGLAVDVLKAMGAKHHIDFTFSKDGSLFSPAYLAQFDAFFFYTTGDLTESGTDGMPPMSPAGKQALLDAIKGGKGFIGVHSASDTFHSPGNKDHGPARYVDDGDRADPFIKMIGAEFIDHQKQQPSRLIVVDSHFPGVAAFAPTAQLTEEWYSLKDFAPDLHVLMVQDTTGMVGYDYARPNYPSTWIRQYGKGRVFYTNLGHRDDVWQSKRYHQLVLGAIRWATGQVDADLTPNLDQVAPQARVLPKPTK